VVWSQVRGLAQAGCRLSALALAEQNDAEIIMGLYIVGAKPNRLMKVGQRLVQTPLLAQGVAQVVMGVGIIRLEAHGLLKAGHRLWQPTLFCEHDPKVVVRLGNAGPEPQSGSQAIDGEAATARLVMAGGRRKEFGKSGHGNRDVKELPDCRSFAARSQA